MAKIIQDTDQRPFTMVYHDCLESDLFDNPYQIVVYIALKKFADNNNQCFPSLKKLASITKMSKRKVQNTLKELQQKHLISIENRLKADGSKSSNLYIIYDFKELWSAGNNEEASETVEKHENDKLIAMLEAQGYIITKGKTMPKNTVMEEKAVPEKEEIVKGETMPEKEELAVSKEVEVEEKRLVPESNQTTGTSKNSNQSTKYNNTAPETKSQPLERYPLEWIKQHFEYGTMLLENPLCQKDIDAVMDILYTALNTTKKTIRINGEDKPAMVVIGKLMKLDLFNINYVIDKFSEQTDRIKNPTAYMLTLLYNAPEQHHLDISNLVQHDLYGTPEQTPEAELTDMQPAAGQAPRQHIPQKEGSGTFE